MAASEADGWGLWGGSVRGWACRGRRCTRSVGITPLLIGCSATDRVQRDGSGAALHGLGLLDADVAGASEETRALACYR